MVGRVIKVLPRSVVVDTNVWLDVYLPNRPGAADAKAFFDAAIERDVNLLYALGSAKDVFFLTAAACKRLAREQGVALSEEQSLAANAYAWAVLDNMAELATVVGSDESARWLASKRRAVHHDFEDNLIIAAAERSGADFIVTADTNLIKHAPVAALTPADITSLLCAE